MKPGLVRFFFIPLLTPFLTGCDSMLYSEYTGNDSSSLSASATDSPLQGDLTTW